MESIAQEKQVSYGFVRVVVDELKRGQYPEYSDYLAYLNDLHWLSEQLSKRKTTLQGAIAGTVLLGTLASAGSNPSELQQLLKLLRRLSPSRYPAEAFVRAALRLAKIEEETGLPFSEIEKKAALLSSKISNMEQNRKALTENISSLKTSEHDARQKLNRTISEGNQQLQRLEQAKAALLASNKMTEEQLRDRRQLQAKLSSYSISFEDLSALAKVLSEFRKYGMDAGTIVGFVQRINGLSQQVDAWQSHAANVEKCLNDGKQSLVVLNGQIAKRGAELEGLNVMRVKLLADLDGIKMDYDKHYLRIDLAEIFLQLLNDPSKIANQQLLAFMSLLASVIKTRESGTKDLLIDYGRARESLHFLIETAAGKTLVWKETQEKELMLLRDKNFELQLGLLGKLSGEKRQLDERQAALKKEEWALQQEKRALGDATKERLLETAVAQMAKGAILQLDCHRCGAKTAVIRGRAAFQSSFFNCPCCSNISLRPKLE
jgi:predicted  nucleic acid-binding Zn-ribbon protein